MCCRHGTVADALLCFVRYSVSCFFCWMYRRHLFLDPCRVAMHFTSADGLPATTCLRSTLPPRRSSTSFRRRFPIACAVVDSSFLDWVRTCDHDLLLCEAYLTLPTSIHRFVLPATPMADQQKCNKPREKCSRCHAKGDECSSSLVYSMILIR
jgi:hypothetical protein